MKDIITFDEDKFLYISLDDARRWYNKKLYCGYSVSVECPVSKQIITSYERKLDWSIVSFLISLARLSQYQPTKDGYHYRKIIDYTIEKLNHSPTNYKQAKHWDLIQSPLNGYFKLSNIGRLFLNEKITLPQTKITLNDEIIFVGKQEIYIGDVNPEHINEYVKSNRKLTKSMLN